jgi:mandelate racemase
VPLRFALGTSAARVTAAPLLLVDLLTREGIAGHAYAFVYRPSAAKAIAALVEDAVALLDGAPVAPADMAQGLRRPFSLLGTVGAARMALSLVDMAAWDALARAAGEPLCRLLGAAPRRLRAYNSCGLGLMEPAALADEAEALLSRGFRAVKLRVGHPTLAGDLAALRAVRDRVGADVDILADYNQGLDPVEAMRRGLALEREGIAWLEEPIRHDDLAGAARLADALAVPLQLGENFNGPADMARALAAGAADLVMPDVARIGGVTGWIAAAGVATSHDVPMSSHLMPEVSAHLLAATPTAHVLEWVDWAEAILLEPLVVEDGEAVVPDRPGSGIEWDEAAIGRLLL